MWIELHISILFTYVLRPSILFWILFHSVNVTILFYCGIQWVNTILKVTKENDANCGFIMHITHILETLVKYIVAIIALFLKKNMVVDISKS